MVAPFSKFTEKFGSKDLDQSNVQISRNAQLEF